MKILTTSYYHDFARYFTYLEDCFRAEAPSCTFYNLCYYPSARKYFVSRKRHAVRIDNAADALEMENVDRIVAEGEYKGLVLDDCIDYNRKTMALFGMVRDSELKRRAVRYIEYFDRLFSSQEFNCFISSGDTRMVTEIAVIMAQRFGVPVWFFEQGPFGTTIIDPEGVNCRISFARRERLSLPPDRERLDSFFNALKSRKKEKYYHDPGTRPGVFRLLQDSLYMYTPCCLGRMFPVEFRTGQSWVDRFILRKLAVRSARRQQRKASGTLPDKFISLILQVPVDAQMLVHSPLYDNFTDMVADVHRALPDGFRLVVREHPQNIGLYGSRLYSVIRKRNIILDNATPLAEVLGKAAVVVVNNSTVGMEALAGYKTVVTLGRAYYNRPGVVYHPESREDLPAIMRQAVDHPVSPDAISHFLTNFIFDYLFQGHFQDLHLQSGRDIARKVLGETVPAAEGGIR